MKYLQHISHKRIAPRPITASTSVTELVREIFLSFNAGRLREACQLFVEKMLASDTIVGLSVSGALTPAGLGMSCLVPLIEAGFVDWIVATGANVYHDTHFALGLELHQSRPGLDDYQLREHHVIRIYDIVFAYDTLLETDRFYRSLCSAESFQRTFSSAEFHYEVGRYLAELEDRNNRRGRSFVAAAYRAGVPIFASSPGDSSIGLNLAELQVRGYPIRLDPLRDVNQSAAIIWQAKRQGRSAVFILGGGSPKNFLLQTEPYIQEILGLQESGHDYFLQITDARPDTGGLSGATPSEAMTWGKVDPQQLPNTIICYLDSTVALPIITAYALANHPHRPQRRIMDHLADWTDRLRGEYLGKSQ